MLGFSDGIHPTPSHKMASMMWIGLEIAKTELRGLSRSASEAPSSHFLSQRKVGNSGDKQPLEQERASAPHRLFGILSLLISSWRFRVVEFC
ncbi:hypothetical protein [Rhizobium mongolense]|uniref:Uncharacterized protein n=1 Tax=Rhizobium mongolense TaxID=57676 RepID=A0ABR6INB0_9HYPH|nr:hypothetical protein [Rhizobium mongolense]MBB4229378.1 hypothetical protein [Rhizobium mongolense]